MAIISISMSDDMLREIDKLKNELGFSARSELLRAGARMLIADRREKAHLEGRINAILMLIHTQNVEDIVTDLKHRFEDITNTQIHSHIREGKCLEIFILEGDAERIKEMVHLFQTCGKMDYVKLIVA